MSRPQDKSAVPRDLPIPAANDPRLTCYIQYLEPTPRGLRACRTLGVKTVGDFLTCDRQDFLAQRNCGPRTYEDLLNRVHRFLTNQETALNPPTTDNLKRALMGLVRNPRAERAFLKLGITTVGEFLATPKDELLKIPGFGERTYWQVTERIRAVTSHEPPAGGLLPDSLLEFPLSGLALEENVRQHLAQLGVDRLRNLFEIPPEVLIKEPGIGDSGFSSIRIALDQLVRVGTERTVDLPPSDESTDDFLTFMERMLSVLEERQRLLFERRVGLGCEPHRLRQIAKELSLSIDEVRDLETNTRKALRDRAPALLGKLHEEADREHRAFEGIIRSEHLAAGSILHSAAKTSGDDLLPLRLIRFCFAHEFYVYSDLVTKIPPQPYNRFRTMLRRYADPRRLPIALSEVERRASTLLDPVPRGLMLYLLKEKQRLRIVIDPERGEVLERIIDSVADRLYEILENADGPMSTEDLLFSFRDQHRRGRMDQILDSLRQDPRFVEIGPRQWCRRKNYLAELEMFASEAERIAVHIVSKGGRYNVLELGGQEGLSERATYLVIDLLRRNPSLRYLGRGDFCSAVNQMSTVMQKICRDFRRAMGEVVLSRFLENQEPKRRRLTARLLEKNRMFIRPCEDRVDLLTNYPFNEERLRRLLERVAQYLARNNGYATAEELVADLNTTDLGGSWLTEYLLHDLLYRNSDFELLPGSLVAQQSLGLAGWIQQRAREAIRAAGIPITHSEVLAEIPELAKFEECLIELLELDPMLQSPDGVHFQVV